MCLNSPLEFHLYRRAESLTVLCFYDSIVWPFILMWFTCLYSGKGFTVGSSRMTGRTSWPASHSKGYSTALWKHTHNLLVLLRSWSGPWWQQKCSCSKYHMPVKHCAGHLVKRAVALKGWGTGLFPQSLIVTGHPDPLTGLSSLPWILVQRGFPQTPADQRI